MKLSLGLNGSPSNVMALASIIATHEKASQVKVTMAMEPQPVEYDDKLRPEDILEVTIKEMGFSVRAYNNLTRAKIHTLRDLVTWTPAAILTLPGADRATGMNEQALNEIIGKLAPYGLSLKPGPEPEPKTGVTKQPPKKNY